MFAKGKKIVVLAAALAVWQPARSAPTDIVPGRAAARSAVPVRAAVLLPLSGEAAAGGEELKNAVSLAVMNARNPNATFQFYDSGASFDSAKAAARKALAEHAGVIIGPLFSREVEGAASAVSGKVPILSLTTDSDVLGKNVYSVSPLPMEQVGRVVSFAASRGYRRFALLTPKSDSGARIRKLARRAVADAGGKVVEDETYSRDSISKVAEEISGFSRRNSEYQKYFDSLSARFEYLEKLKSFPDEYSAAYDSDRYASTNAEMAAIGALIEDLKKKNALTPPPFDALFIYGDDVNELVMMGSMLLYYAVSPGDVKFLGLAQFENAKVLSERAFRGAWFPAPSAAGAGQQFEAAYRRYFGAPPSRLAYLAYDAAALVLAAGGEGMTDQEGFVGLSGLFRLAPDGRNERALDILEITGAARAKTRVVSAAEGRF